ncbi:CynX/NimT family MFS transporter [Bradyrhizobium jicamae]|uniref:MFS transporter n=1 Tax=Bradyrhizobium jicamae TaxID=280332 RepID=UPI001BA9339B|nr:MFS transporter [Bradyrhizobium jicamae]MBR0936277.1 MFS transporter [Bradyrhizobium jicamae]
MPNSRWTILAVLFAARAMTGFQFQSVGSVTSALMGDLALSYAEIGMLLGAYLLPGVVVALPAGLIGQRINERTLGVIGLLLMALSGAALGHADGLVTALIARVIGGVGATIIILVATKMTTDWFDGREIVLAMSLLQMSWPFGAMVALPVQTWLLNASGWPAVMLSGATGAAAVLVVFMLLPRQAPQTQAQVASKPGARLPSATLLPVIVAGTIWGVMNLSCILFFSYAPLLLQAQGLTSTTAASLTSLAIWFTIVAIPVGGYLVHRSGKPVAAIIGCGLVAAVSLTLFAAGIHPALIGLIFGAAIGPLSGAILSLPARVLEPQDRSLGFGVFYTCFYVLMALGPSAAGRLQDALHTPAAALFAGAALLASMVPLVLLFLSLSWRREAAAIRSKPELRVAS